MKDQSRQVQDWLNLVNRAKMVARGQKKDLAVAAHFFYEKWMQTLRENELVGKELKALEKESQASSRSWFGGKPISESDKKGGRQGRDDLPPASD